MINFKNGFRKVHKYDCETRKEFLAVDNDKVYAMRPYYFFRFIVKCKHFLD